MLKRIWTLIATADVTARFDIRRASGISDYLLSNLPPGDGKAKPLSPTNSDMCRLSRTCHQKNHQKGSDIVTDVEAKSFAADGSAH